ncbi:MAG: hypothetical protein B6242_11070 [Anaerolineaceae bacterium 4572_78]|nr:MAG: hypothetical protein B6242_11070 [Anaerolineaceae bacterium 4572_78]
MAISSELMEILRCPYCVSGKTRQPGDDPGRLELVKDDTWLVCVDSGHKYPIREDVPVMLIEEGEKWKETPVEELPEPGNLVESSPTPTPSESYDTTVSHRSGPDPLIFVAIGGVVVLLLILFFILRGKHATVEE